MALRETVARLLAYIATHDEETEELLRHFGESGDVWVDSLQLPDNQAALQFAEAVRLEKDLVLKFARAVIEGAANAPCG